MQIKLDLEDKPLLTWIYVTERGNWYGNSIKVHLPLDPAILEAFKKDIEETLSEF